VAAFGRKRVRDAREAGTASSGFRDHAKRWCAALVETRMVLLGLSEEVDRLVHGESK
jgi:hypothetical protein